MGKLLRIAFAAAVAAAALAAIRRLLEAGAPAGGGEEQAPPAPAATRAAAARPASTRAVAPSASANGPSRDQLYREAARLEVKGRSRMNKEQLQEAVEAAKIGGNS